MADPLVPEATIAPPPAASTVPVAEPLAPAALPVPGGTGDAAVAEPAVLPPSADKAPPLASERPSLLETFLKDGDIERAAAAKAEPEKPAEAPKVEAEAKPTEAVKPAAEVKPAEPAKAEEAAKPADAASVPAAFEPVKYTFELPEGLKADEAKIEAFSGILNAAQLPAELGKDVGQKLLALHNEAAREYADFVAREQHRVFNETRDGWNKDVLAHPEIGGAGHVTAMRAIARVRDALLSSAAPGTPEYETDAAQHEEFLRITGAGDHPVWLAMLHRADKFIGEPQSRDVPVNIRPPKGNGAKPKGGIYNHPTSQNMGQ